MRRLSLFILLSGLCLVCGCAAVRSRTIGYRQGGVGGPPFFSGVSLDYIQVFDRDSITDPGMRFHPALAVVDAPFSFAGDILFLPYDVMAFVAFPP